LLLLTSWQSADATTTARIERLEEVVADLRREGVSVERLEIGNLDDAEIESFAEAIFPGNHFEADHPWFPQALAEVSGGQPFFLLQILRALRTDPSEQPVVRRVDGVWRLDGDLDEERFRRLVPDAVEEVVRQRLRALDASTLEVAEVAALLGEEFEVALLVEILDDGAAVDAALEDLERAALARAVDPRLLRYRFSHVLTATVLAQGVESRSPREARRRHREIVAAMRVLYGESGLRRRAVQLGRHLAAAGSDDEAFRALVEGARSLMAQQAYPRAWSALTDAQKLLERSGDGVSEEDRDAFLLLRGEVAKLTGRYEEGLTCFGAVVAAAPDGPRVANAYSQMGRIHEFRGEYDHALFCYSVGKDLREEAGDEAGLRRSMNSVGRIQLRRGETERARRTFTEVLLAAERARDRAAMAEAVLQLGTLDLQAGRLDEARSAYRRSLRQARKLGHRGLVAQGLNGLGNVAYREGRMDRALTNHRRALALRRGLGDREGLSNSYNNLGAIHAHRGHDETALGYYERSAALHRSLGSQHGLAVVLGNIAEILLRLGEVTRAREAAGEAVRIRREFGEHAALGTSLTVLGDAEEAAGRDAAASAAWEEAVALEDATAGEGPVGPARLRLVRRALDDDPAAAARRLAAAGERLRRRPDPDLELEVDFLAAETALRWGDSAAALQIASAAAIRARRGWPLPARARARRLRARALVALGRTGAGVGVLRRVVRDLEAGGAPRPARAEALLDLSRVLVSLGRPSARRNLLGAADLFEDLVRRGRHDRELEEIRRAVGEVSPGDGS
jgi:tetratricopeptide (TPR) repeat protein